jgi:TM2 domain-containing membrane protein YozV
MTSTNEYEEKKMPLILCPECNNQISDVAPACPACGFVLKDNVIFIKHEKSGLLAAGLSLIIPGAGQLYKGRVFSAIIWFLLIGTGYVTFFLPGLILHAACVLMAGIAKTK